MSKEPIPEKADEEIVPDLRTPKSLMEEKLAALLKKYEDRQDVADELHDELVSLCEALKAAQKSLHTVLEAVEKSLSVNEPTKEP